MNNQTASEMKDQLRESLPKYKKDRSSLVPILQEVQAKFGYLPREAMLEVSNFLRIPASEVFGVVTFYAGFRLIPPGKHAIKVCMGTACHMRGGGLILETLERELDIKVGGVTQDLEFQLDRVACVGCCALAPVVIIDERVYPRMTTLKSEEALVPSRYEEVQGDSVSGEVPVGPGGK
jgi:NADH-quinone oxidoreductase subunit E